MCRCALSSTVAASISPPARINLEGGIGAAIDQLSAKKPPKWVALSLLIEQFSKTISDARIILAFHVLPGSQTMSRTLQGIREKNPSAVVIDAHNLNKQNSALTLHRFSNPGPDSGPQILVLNSSSKSETAQGIAADADYCVFCDDVSGAIVNQVLGRMLRPNLGKTTGNGRDGVPRVIKLVSD
jgi:hypothetical protein